MISITKLMLGSVLAAGALLVALPDESTASATPDDSVFEAAGGGVGVGGTTGAVGGMGANGGNDDPGNGGRPGNGGVNGTTN